MSGTLNGVIAAIDKFERDLGFTAPELTGMRIGELRSRVRSILDDTADEDSDQAATVIVVTEHNGRERPIHGDNFTRGLFGVTIQRGGKDIAFYPAGSFLNVREDLANPPAASITDLYRSALERLADEDTPVLGEGLGGGAQEELHVRASFAAHTLGRTTCGCTECRVSLGLHDDEDGEQYQRELAEEGDRVGHAGDVDDDERHHHADEDDDAWAESRAASTALGTDD